VGGGCWVLGVGGKWLFQLNDHPSRGPELDRVAIHAESTQLVYLFHHQPIQSLSSSTRPWRHREQSVTSVRGPRFLSL
jgi:hypothetical protein